MAKFRSNLLPYQLVMGLVSGSVAGIIALLGELRDQLGFSETSIGIIVACGFFASFVSQVGFARFADRGFGREMAIIGIALSAVALFAMVVVDTVLLWCVSRALLGFAGGLVLPGLRRAATVLDPENVGENLGRLIVGEIGGFILGPVAVAGIVQFTDLRTPFLVLAILSLMFLPFIARLPDDVGEKDTESATSFELLKVRRLQGGLILIFGYFVLIGAFESVLPLMFTDRGAEPWFIGVAFSAFALPIVIISTRAGRTADRIGPPKVAIAGMGISAAATATYGLIPELWMLMIVMMFVGLADGYGFIAGQVLVSRSVAEARQAGALGLMGAAEVLGAAVSAVPAAYLYGRLGEAATWPIIAAIAIVLLAIGAVRIRDTEPVNTGGLDVEWTPIDRHPSPEV